MNCLHCRFLLAGLAGYVFLAPALLEAGDAVVAPKSDKGKFGIEAPAQTLVATKSGPVVTGDFVNPKVQPGLVHWHPTLAAACEAARKSGKPVFLFQMMGKLDDQFC